MPFTGSHPAIILPLLRLRILSVSGLIMGSMVPDFEFFVTLNAHIVHGHSLLAIFWLNIPLALLCITVYHYVVRNQMILNLPEFFGKRFRPFLTFDWFSYFKANYLQVIFSIIIGNLSHLLWDDFTHSYGFVVNTFEIFQMEFFNTPVYNLLQYGFSVLGAFAIFKFIFSMPDRKLIYHTPVLQSFAYWGIVLAVTLSVYYLRYDPIDYGRFTARVVFVCAGFLAGLILASLSFILMKPKRFMKLAP